MINKIRMKDPILDRIYPPPCRPCQALCYVMTSLNDKRRSRIIIGLPSGKIAVHESRDRIQDSSSGAASTILVNRGVNEIENTTKSCVRCGYVRDEIRLVDVKKIFLFFPSQSQRLQRVVIVGVVLVVIIKIPPLATPTRACLRECEYRDGAKYANTFDSVIRLTAKYVSGHDGSGRDCRDETYPRWLPRRRGRPRRSVGLVSRR